MAIQKVMGSKKKVVKKKQSVKQKKKYVVHDYTESDIEKALDNIRKGMSINAASIQYKIPKTTLYVKYSGKVPVVCKKGPKPILTDEEETRIVNWILDKARLGFPMNIEEVKDAVKNVLNAANRETPFANNRPGNKWVRLFLARHPNVKRRYTDIISKARASVTEENLREWHVGVETYLKEKGLEDILNRPESIFNGDETGVLLTPKCGKVLGPADEENLYEIAAGKEKENLTVLCSFNAAGKAVEPMILFPYQRVPGHLAESVPEDWYVGKSDSGWMVSGTFYEYITNAFHPWCVKNNIPFPVIYFMDGHKSHLTYELSEFCDQNGIILCALPPNSTHIMQPCDVSIFRALKLKWRHVVECRKQKSQKSISKATFAPLFKKAFDQLTSDSVKNGFKTCGLYPFDADAINFQKCISTRRKNLSVNAASHHSSSSLEYEDYVSTEKFFNNSLSEDKIREFEQMKNRNEASSDPVYHLWKICVENLQAIENSPETANNFQNTDDYFIKAMSPPISNSDLDGTDTEFDNLDSFDMNNNNTVLSLCLKNEDGIVLANQEPILIANELIIANEHEEKSSFIHVMDVPVIDVSNDTNYNENVQSLAGDSSLQKLNTNFSNESPAIMTGTDSTKIIDNDKSSQINMIIQESESHIAEKENIENLSSTENVINDDADSVVANTTSDDVKSTDKIPDNIWEKYLHWPEPSEKPLTKVKKVQKNKVPRVAIGSDLMKYQQQVKEEQEKKKLEILQRAAEKKMKKEELENPKKKDKEERLRKKEDCIARREAAKNEAAARRLKKKTEAEAKKERAKIDKEQRKRNERKNNGLKRQNIVSNGDSKLKRQALQDIDANCMSQSLEVLDLSESNKECDINYLKLNQENVNTLDNNFDEIRPLDFSMKAFN